MTPLKLLKILGAVCAVLVLLVIYYFYRQVPHQQAPYAASIDKASRIVLRQGSAKAQLDRENKEWKVSAGTGPVYAVEDDRLKALLNGLGELHLEDEISDRADRAPDFDVTPESGTRLTLTDSKGATLADGIIGKAAPDYVHTYFRFPDKPQVYLSRGLSRAELGPGADVNGWRKHDLVAIPETQIQSIRIEGKGFTTDLARSSDTWTLAGKKIDPGPVNALVGTLAHLRAETFVAPSTSTVTSADALTYARVLVTGTTGSAEIRIGPQDPVSKRYPVSTGAEAGLAWVNDYSIKAILQKPSAFKEKK